MKYRSANRHTNKNFIGVGVGLIALVVILAMSFTIRQLESDAQVWVKHTLKVKSDITSILSLINDAETGQRGFLLTGKDHYLEPHNLAINTIAESLSVLQKSTQDNSSQQKNIANLRALVEQKLSVLQQTISLFKQGRKQDAYDLVNSDEGQIFMANIRHTMANMTALEEDLLLKRQNKLTIVSRFNLFSELMTPIIFVVLLYYARAFFRLTREIKNSETLLNNLLQATTNGIISVDKKGTIQSANAFAEHIFSYSAEEMIGQPLEMLIPKKYHTRHRKDVQRYVSEGKNAAMAAGRNVYGIKKNGEKIPVEIGLSKIKLENGSVQIVATISDITEKKKSADALESIGYILEESLNEVYIFDAKTLAFIQANRGARSNTGYTLDELQVLTPIDITPKITREEFTGLVAPLLSGEKEKLIFDTVHQRKDGSEYNVEMHLQRSVYTEQEVFVAITLDISERKHAEALRLRLSTELNEASELNRAILASSSHLIISTNPKGTVTQFNAASEAQLGYKAGNIVGKESPAIWHDSMEVAKRAAELSKELGKPIESGFDVFTIKPRECGPESHEWTFTRKDGSRFLGNLTVTCIRNENKKIMGYVAIVEDITERKQVEEALLESKHFMQLIFDNSPSLIFVKDENLKFVEANKKFLALYPKKERSKVLGRYSFEGCDKKELKALQKYDQMALEEGYSAATETLQFPNGAQRTMYTQKVRFKDTKDQRFILGIASDITEYEAELLLLQQMHGIFSDANLGFSVKIQKILDEGCRYYQLPTGIVSEIQGDQYRIFSVSNNEALQAGESFNLEQTYCSITYNKSEPYYAHDFGQSEFCGHPCYALFHLDTYIGCKIMVNGVAFGTVNFSGAEKRDKAFSSREIAMLKHIAQWIGFEITQQHYVAEKDRLIAKLSHSNRELEQFAYVASHDLKEPIRTLKTFTGYLIKDVEAGKQERADQDKSFIDSACERMTNLIDDLLQLSSVGNSEYKLATWDFKSLIEEILLTLQVRIKETNAKIHIEDASVPIYVDKTQLSLALQNLLQNALKFHKPNETPEIYIRADRGNGSTNLTVRDKGIGIAKDQTEKVFGIFQKLHNPSEYAGTGIGLAVVSKIMARHQGSVTVESEESKGACFTLHLPLQREPITA